MVNHAAPCVKVPFSHFVCATLCSASVGTNSGNFPPIWPLPAQQVVLVGIRTMVVAARTKVGKGNGWKTGVRAFISCLISFIYCFLVCFVHVF
ncbi:hypothetical protein E2C01_077774 [Portunus trituberculatus]|uniref:Uncharacterized protein n=1 Tax=Portunus trituberculatus TaxID=210409 RepID=A0A5B7IL24_PORTR|nr:hypothetical protein [Portunus trituberculatus]